jgi:transposase
MKPEPFDPWDAREWRRMQAWRLKQLGWQQRDIAQALSASESAVSRWLGAARSTGTEALQSRPIPGRPAKLTPEQLRLLPDCLWHGPEAYGFRGEVWTCARVAKVIAEEFGVSYHPGHVARLLKELKWTPQIPGKRAIQADDVEIEHWRAVVWPALKAQARRERRILVFIDESGFYLLPGVVRSYGPQGQTPLLAELQTHDHLSVMGGVTPAGKLFVLVRQETLNGLHTVAFLQHLLRHLGARLLVIWDRSPIHRRAAVTEFLHSKAGREMHVEMLPAYAPQLNPMDQGGCWQHLKHVEMRNLACLDLEELHYELHLAIGRLRQKPHIIRSFFKAAGLSL